MSVYTGLLQGFSGAVTESRARRAAEQESQIARDQKIFEHLMTADDPEIKMAALAGMESLASGTYKQKKGIDRFLGRGGVTPNPHVARVFEMLRSGGFEGTGSAPAREAAPVSQAPAAAPTPKPPPSRLPPDVTFETGQGAPPPTPLLRPADPQGGHPAMSGVSFGVDGQAAAEAAASPQAAAPPPQPNTPPRPRQLFLSDDERTRRGAVARAQGDVEGDVAGLVAVGLTPEQARTEVLGQRRRTSAANAGYREGEIVKKPDGSWVQVLYDPRDPSQQVEIPATDPKARVATSATGQTWAEGNVIPDKDSPTGYSQELYLRADPMQRQRIPAQPPLTPATMAARTTAVTIARNNANAAAPLSTQQNSALLGQLQDDWRKATANTQTMRQQLSVMQTALSRAADDPVGSSEGMRTAMVKLFDPNAAVREGDYSRLGLGLSTIDKVEGFLQSTFMGGGNIPLPIMKEMVETAQQVVDASTHWNDVERKRLTDTANQYKVPAHLVFGEDPTVPAAAGTPPPNPGAPPVPGVNTAPAGAPRVGDPVGNVVTPEMKTGTSNGRRVVQLPDGTIVPITKGTDGVERY